MNLFKKKIQPTREEHIAAVKAYNDAHRLIPNYSTATGRHFGMVEATQEEYDFYKSLTPEEQDAYPKVKAKLNAQKRELIEAKLLHKMGGV